MFRNVNIMYLMSTHNIVIGTFEKQMKYILETLGK